MTDIFKSADWAREAEEKKPKPLPNCIVAERGDNDRPNGFYKIIDPSTGETLARGLTIDEAKYWGTDRWTDEEIARMRARQAIPHAPYFMDAHGDVWTITIMGSEPVRLTDLTFQGAPVVQTHSMKDGSE